MKNKLNIALAILNLGWSAGAWIYDLAAIKEISPFLLLPFLVICPLYPLLLATVWFSIDKFGKTNPWLFAFATIPSLCYFIGSLIYYPAWMIANSFDWLTFGQLLWVAFYGLQSIYLLSKYPMKTKTLIAATAFLALSFLVQYQTKTQNYLDFTNLSDRFRALGYSLVIILTILMAIILRKRNLLENKIKPKPKDLP